MTDQPRTQLPTAAGFPFPPIPSKHVRNIAMDVVITILTCGLYNFYVQQRQMEAVNDMLKVEKYQFNQCFFFTTITCGLYHIYHEYRKSLDIAAATNDPNTIEAIVNLALTMFGLGIVADAIQQAHINRYYGETRL